MALALLLCAPQQHPEPGVPAHREAGVAGGKIRVGWALERDILFLIAAHSACPF